MSDLPFSPARLNPIRENGRGAVPGLGAVSKQTLCLREAEDLVAEVENGQVGKLDASPKLCFVLQREVRVAALNRAVRQTPKSRGFNKSESVSLFHQFQSLGGGCHTETQVDGGLDTSQHALPGCLRDHFREKDRAGRDPFR